MISCDASMIVLANINRLLSICSYIMSEMVFVRTNVSTLTATDNHDLHRPAVIIIIRIIIRELLRIMTIKMGIKPSVGSLLFISTLCELTWIVVGYVYVKAL